MITEAVKYLVAQGVSALVIKNVLHLPIPDQALRYADARDFPVFVVTADNWFFDEVIYSVDKHIEDLANLDFVQRELDALLEDAPDDAARQLGQHANTVRYRLDKVRVLTGLDYRQPDQAEQLSLACAIDAASRLR